MLTRTLRAGTAALCLLAPPATAQDAPPRIIGPVDVDAITAAPLMHLRSVAVDADPAAIFDYVARSENWPAWFGGAVTGIEGDRPTRTVALEGGGSLTETILTFEAPGSGPGVYGWSQPDGNLFGYTDHYAAIEVAPDPEGGAGARVTLRGYFDTPEPESVLPLVEGGFAAIAEGVRGRFGGAILQEVTGTDPVVVVTTRVVDAPAATVWRVVADEFGEVAEWASVISENTISGDADGLLGAERTCFIPGFGSKVAERVTLYDAEAGRFAYEVVEGAPPFVTKASSDWAITDRGDGTTEIVSTVTMAIAEGTPQGPVGVTREGFAQILSVSLDDLAHYVETGAPHPRELASR